MHSREWRILRSVPTSSEYERMLRGAALRVTRPRLAVLGAVHALPHADTDSLFGAVRRELPGVSHQAVYDVLRALTGAGLVRRIQPAGSVARYESRVGDNHHHVVCRSCGAISDVDCAVGDTPCLTASDDQGFSIDEAEVIYWGVCPDCAASETDHHNEPSRQEKDRRV
jgi:Fur family ferric uptake transcriptional regulator